MPHKRQSALRPVLLETVLRSPPMISGKNPENGPLLNQNSHNNRSPISHSPKQESERQLHHSSHDILKNEDLAHEDRIERRSAIFTLIFGGIAGDLFEDGTKALPIDEGAQFKDADFTLGDFFLVIKSSKEISTTVDLAICPHPRSYLSQRLSGNPK